jgi:hypothetical protein
LEIPLRYRHDPVDALPFGIQKIVGFARALALEPPNGFADHGRSPQQLELPELVALRPSGQENDGNAGGLWILPQMSECLDVMMPVMDLGGRESVFARSATPHRDCGVEAERNGHDFADAALIVNVKHAKGDSCDLFLFGRRGIARQALAQWIQLRFEIDCHAGHMLPAGQLDVKDRSAAGRISKAHLAAEPVNDLLHDAETKPGAALLPCVCGIGLGESLKDARLEVG